MRCVVDKDVTAPAIAFGDVVWIEAFGSTARADKRGRRRVSVLGGSHALTTMKEAADWRWTRTIIPAWRLVRAGFVAHRIFSKLCWCPGRFE